MKNTFQSVGWKSSIFIALLKQQYLCLRIVSFAVNGLFVSFFLYYSYCLAVFNSAFQCSQCLKYCHKQCCETADSISPCRGQPDSTSNQELLFTAFPVNHSLAENSLNFYENFIKSMAWKKEDDMQPVQNNVSYRVTTPIANSTDDSDDESLQDGTLRSYSSSLSESGNDTIVIPGDHKLSLSLYDDDNGVLSYPGLLTVIVQQATEVPFSNVIIICYIHTVGKWQSKCLC